MTMTGTPLIQNAAVVKLDNSTGTLTDYSDQITASSLTMRLTVGSYYVLSGRDEQQVTGAAPRGYDLSLTVIKTDGANDLYDRLMDMAAGSGTAGELANISVELYDPDETSGSEKWAGEFVLVNAGTPLMKTSNSGDVESNTFQFRANGAVTRSIVT